MAPSRSEKRSVALDFFTRVSKRKTLPGNSTFATHIESNICDVPGLKLIPDFVDSTEESELLKFLDSPRRKWRTDLARRSLHFGGTYCCLPSAAERAANITPEMKHAPPIPSELHWLVDRMVSKGVYNEHRPEFCIVNEYVGTQGISAHTENFQFAQPVVGLSLGSPDIMRFHEMKDRYDGSVRSGKAAKAPYTGRKVDVLLPSRSLVVMTGDSRWKWQHEIRRIRGSRGAKFKRTSLTFRIKNGT